METLGKIAVIIISLILLLFFIAAALSCTNMYNLK